MIFVFFLCLAFAEADRWRSACLLISHSPSSSENGNNQQPRRRASSGGGTQVVSTTSKLSPDISDPATSDALQRHFIACPIYRAKWGPQGDLFYFKTISLPFLRNQGCGCTGEEVKSAPGEATNVFSPTSSFENLLLLNYHSIIGLVARLFSANARTVSCLLNGPQMSKILVFKRLCFNMWYLPPLDFYT